jgi:tRNA A37 threonylcarbamoyladenosine dehydratase
MMPNRQIKFIWDFYGVDAVETAKHHVKHLNTFFTLNAIEFAAMAVENMSDMHCMAYVISAEDNVKIIRDTLRPHRATIES